MLVRRYVVFTVPLNRLDETRDGKPTWEALRRSLVITGHGLQRVYDEAKDNREYRIKFKATLGQFAMFLILRAQFGGANWFSELQAQLVDQDGRPVDVDRFGHRVDPVRVHDVTGEHGIVIGRGEFKIREADWYDISG